MYYFIMIILMVVIISSQWKIFCKAGEAGWKALIPFYSGYTMAKISCSTKEFWIAMGGLATISLFGLFSYITVVPGYLFGVFSMLICILVLAAFCRLSIRLAYAFGKTKRFGIGLLLIPGVFYPTLGFGKSEYVMNPR